MYAHREQRLMQQPGSFLQHRPFIEAEFETVVTRHEQSEPLAAPLHHLVSMVYPSSLVIIKTPHYQSHSAEDLLNVLLETKRSRL